LTRTAHPPPPPDAAPAPAADRAAQALEALLARIVAALAALPPAERRVARLLLDDPRGFAAQPVARLAAQAQVSKPTVVRFCRRVGYDGLADFKRKLAGTVDEGVPYVHVAVDDDDKPADLIAKIVDNSVAGLLSWRRRASAQGFERAIAALAEAGRLGRRIEFHGIGNSAIVALDAQHKFFRLGVRSAAVGDAHVQVMSATMLAPGDVAVLLSNSGRSRDLLDVAAIAKRRGATTVLITASGSPLAALGSGERQVLIAADHPEDHDRYSPMVSRLLHLVIVDILATGVALRLGSQRLQPLLQDIKRTLRATRYVGGDTTPSNSSAP
jgi:RpiR family carbohydrate utilization transcriptional regulator